MNWRVLGMLLGLLLLGGGAGYAWASASDDPVAFTDPVPVPAQSPQFPAGQLEVVPDAPDEPLDPAVSLAPQVKGNYDFGVEVPAPTQWARTDPAVSDAVWSPVEVSDPKWTYLLRIRLIQSQNLSVAQARDERIRVLRQVSDDFDLERSTDDTFVANYVTQNHRRLAMERFLSMDRTEDPADPAYLTIVVVGRMSDRDGLSALLDRVTAGAVRRNLG